MLKNRKLKIAMVCRTKGLEYDDRIRKECITLNKKAEIKIFVNFVNNKKEVGVTSYGIPFESFKLKTRDALPSGKYLILKSIEFYAQIYKKLKNYDVIWAHESYTYLFPLLGNRGKYIWDQHEIPIRFLKFPLRSVFHLIERKCVGMIHANDYRKEYLQKMGLIEQPSKHHTIRNYPDDIFLNVSEASDKIKLRKFQRWLDDHDYVYLQGLSFPRRYPFKTVEAVIQETDLKIIITGSIEPNAKNKLLKKYGDKLYERVFFCGMVDQLDIPMYLKNAKFSIILYDTLTANNRYCEPNRMYQSIALNVPVIVGCNEPMKELIEKYKFGVAMGHDGRDFDDLRNQVSNIMNSLTLFENNIRKHKSKIIWRNQESDILKIINK